VKTRHKAKTSETMSEAVPPTTTTFSVVRQQVEATTPEGAIEEMEAAGHQFLVYLDKDTDQIHVVFRRTDETFGIVHPVRKTKR
jgi:putative sigma-54 modulation protein